MFGTGDRAHGSPTLVRIGMCERFACVAGLVVFRQTAGRAAADAAASETEGEYVRVCAGSGEKV